MKQRVFMVEAHNPLTGETLRVPYTELDLRQTIARSIAQAVHASSKIEGEETDYPPEIDPWSIPDSLLTAD